MKNIHILPTDQPSRLWIDTITGKLILDKEPNALHSQHIYITSDEEIKDKDYVLSDTSIGALYLDGEMNTSSMLAEGQWKKVILTTDPALIADGVQSISEEFLEWVIKNPTCEFIKVTKLDYLTNRQYRIYNLPQEEPKQEKEEEYFKHLEKDKKEFAKEWEEIRQEFGFGKKDTLEEAAEKYSQGWGENDDVKSFIAGGKHMAEKMYSEEEVLNILHDYRNHFELYRNIQVLPDMFFPWFEQFKKK